MNYIKSLQMEISELRSSLKTWDDSVNAFRAFLGSEKFQGVETDGSRKDWIATADVINWLRDVQSAVGQEVPPARKVSDRGAKPENLDAFLDPVALVACVTSAAALDGAPDAYRHYGICKAEAMTLRAKGEIALALQWEGAADRSYAKIPDAWKW